MSLSNYQSRAGLLPSMITLITASWSSRCIAERYGKKVLRLERRNNLSLKQLSSDVGCFSFVRILGCVSDCERNASDLSALRDDGDGADQCVAHMSLSI